MTETTTGTACPACHRPGRAGARFCAGCGAPLPAAPVLASRPFPVPPPAHLTAYPSPVPPPRGPGSGPFPPLRSPFGAPSGSWPAPTPAHRPRMGPPAPAVIHHGRPASQGGATWAWVLCGVALALIVVAVAAVVMLRASSTPTLAGAQPVLTPYSAPDATTSDTSASTDPGSVATDPAAVTDPEQPLRALAATDAPSVTAIVGQWVPELSSKKVGLVADGRTYDAVGVAADHQALRSSYPGAVLVWSGDYTSFTNPDFWVTVVARPFPTADAANAWCASQGLDGDHCFAKRLSHSGGPAGNTRARR